MTLLRGSKLTKLEHFGLSRAPVSLSYAVESSLDIVDKAESWREGKGAIFVPVDRPATGPDPLRRTTMADQVSAPPFIVFGYGSLIFKVYYTHTSWPHRDHPHRTLSSHLRMWWRKVLTFCDISTLWGLCEWEVPGFLKGYVRRFAQKSHDHRGTPEVGRAVPPRSTRLFLSGSESSAVADPMVLLCP